MAQAQSYDTYDQYAPLGKRHAGLIVSQSQSRQWATLGIPLSQKTLVGWGNPNWLPLIADCGKACFEEFEIRTNCYAGHSFVFFNAYQWENGIRFAVRTVKAEYRINDGPWVDITGGCGLNGHPYRLYNIYAQDESVRVWGEALNWDGTFAHKFFWQATYTRPMPIYNICWIGQGSSTRQAIKQEESYWTDYQGWGTGSGSIGSNGLPDGVEVVYGRFQTIAKDAGYGWTFGNYKNGSTVDYQCLETSWGW